MDQIAAVRQWWSTYSPQAPVRPWAIIHGAALDLRDNENPLVSQLRSAGVRMTSVLDVDAAADEGADLILLLDYRPDLCHTIAVVSDVTGEDFVELVGELEDIKWMDLVSQIRDLRALGRRRGRQEMLHEQLTQTVAALERAQQRKIAVVLGGLTEVAAALLVDGSWQAAHDGAIPAHRSALRHLRLAPLINSGSQDPVAAGLGFSALLSMLRM